MRVGNPLSTAVERDKFENRSNEFFESEIVNTQQAIPASDQQGPLPPRGATTIVSVVNKSDGAIPTVIKPRRDLWDEAFAKLSQDRKDLLSKIEKLQAPEEAFTKLTIHKKDSISKVGRPQASKTVVQVVEQTKQSILIC